MGEQQRTGTAARSWERMEGYSREQVLQHAVGENGGVQQRTGTAARRRERMEGYSREQILQHAVRRD